MAQLDCPALAAAGSVLDFHGEWLIVRVRPQRERSFSRQLSIADVPHFLPIEAIRRFYAGEAKIVERIPWPGYVFACGGDAVWWEIAAAAERCGLASSSRNPAGYIQRVRYPARLVFCLHAYQQAMRSGRPTQQENIRPGSRVSIVGGSFMGFAGIAERVTAGYVHIVTLFMGTPRTVEVAREMVEIQ